MSVLRGVSSVVELLADVTAQPLKASSENEARALLCRAFESEWLDVASLVNAPAMPAQPPASCALGQVEFSGTEDGRWHLLGFPGDVFVDMYEPPERDAVYPPTSWSIRQAGPLAIHLVLQPAYVCPTNAADLCVAWRPGDDDSDVDTDPESLKSRPKIFYCTDERALPCNQQRYNSEVYVLDPATGRTVAFGPFKRENIPTVTVRPSARALTMSTSSCRTELSF